MRVSTALIVPMRPLRTSSQASRKRGSERCWLPTWKTVFLSRAILTRALPSSMVSVSGFSQ